MQGQFNIPLLCSWDYGCASEKMRCTEAGHVNLTDCFSTGHATEMFVSCSPFLWASGRHFSVDTLMDLNCYTL